MEGSALIIDYNNIDWSERFAVSEDSPSGLIYTKSIYAGKTGKSLIKSAGESVGCKSYDKLGNPKSWEVGYNSKLYKAHRIVYVLWHGHINSSLVIDHIDGNPFNNQISNLRQIPKSENHRNARKFRNNKSGHAGVYWQEMNKGKHLYAVAEVTYDGKKSVKCFGTHQYADALSEAVNWRQMRIQELNNDFAAGYTERHGK